MKTIETLRNMVHEFVRHQKRPISIQRLSDAFPDTNRQKLLLEVWSLAGDGLIEFDLDWKIKLGPGWVPIDH